jgi:MFS family permease
VLLCGYIAYGLVYAGMGVVVHNGWQLFALFAGYGLFMAATEGVEKALVADSAPSDRQGTAFGWFNLTVGALLLPSSVIFGWLYEAFSPWVAFSFSAGCAFLAATLLLRWTRFDGLVKV